MPHSSLLSYPLSMSRVRAGLCPPRLAVPHLDVSRAAVAFDFFGRAPRTYLVRSITAISPAVRPALRAEPVDNPISGPTLRRGTCDLRQGISTWYIGKNFHLLTILGSG
jgi:hypothetical protein